LQPKSAALTPRSWLFAEGEGKRLLRWSTHPLALESARVALGHSLLVVLLLGNLSASFLLLRRVRSLTHKVDRQADKLERRTSTISEQGKALLDELRQTTRTLDEHGRQILSGQGALESLAGVYTLPFRAPIFFGAWSIDGAMARELVDSISRHRPRVIVELGSGSSTALIAVTLERLGLRDTRHIAVDHLAEFLEATKAQVALQVDTPRTEFWLCPLTPKTPATPPWYSDLVTRLAGTEIDLLLVDGPPAALHPKARRPALDQLRPFLSSRAIVLLDDANRPREKKTVEAWQKAHPDMAVRIVDRGKGFAEFRVREAGTPVPSRPDAADEESRFES